MAEQRTPWQSLQADAEVMEEIRDRLASRRRFPLQAELPAGKRSALESLDVRPTESLRSPAERLTEAIVLSVGRPSLLIRDGRFDEPELEVWKQRLATHRERVQAAIPSVGRVELYGHLDYDWVGTAWVIDDGVLVTNRHVAEVFAERRGDRFLFRPSVLGGDLAARIDFREELGGDEPFELGVEEVLFIAGRGALDPDVAFLRVGGDGRLPAPIELSAEGPRSGGLIGTVGYPARDSRNGAADQARIFRDIFDVKRFAPGYVTGTEDGPVFNHDCTTLGGASGSPILDLESGEAVGLHFGGRFQVGNYAVRSPVVRELLVRRGRVAVPGGGDAEPADGSPEDYEGCEGYCEDFLGGDAALHVALPELGAELRADAVPVAGACGRGMSSYVLDYTHFSVVQSRSRRLAFYTAVNIDGNQEVLLRRRRTPWKIDPRIPRETQAGNELYRHNRLDRGHLVRRLDPVWGDDETARRADAESFHYTNAAPQHAQLNQRSWLSLEDFLLDNTNQRDLKLTVFTGPVFAASDPEYRGFKIPREFWKVIAMVAPTGALHATAYLLSQDRFLDDIEFVFGGFRTYQVPIASVEEATGIGFGNLRQQDPLERVESIPMRPIEGPEDLIL